MKEFVLPLSTGRFKHDFKLLYVFELLPRNFFPYKYVKNMFLKKSPDNNICVSKYGKSVINWLNSDLR